jgi:hypothetical protein
MGCVEARIESAIAAYHIGPRAAQSQPSKKAVLRAWANADTVRIPDVHDDNDRRIEACGWCQARGHGRK